MAQPQRVAGLAYGAVAPTQWGQRERTLDFFDLKGDLEALLAPVQAQFEPAQHPAMHPGRCAQVRLGDRVIGHLGELHPRWRQAYELPQAPLVFELDLDAVMDRPLPQVQPVARHQGVWRDLALVASERVTHDSLIQALRADPDGLVQAVTLFDVYRPAAAVPELAEGERSLAVRLELLDAETTLTDERIDAAVAAAVARVQSAFGGRLRA